MSVTLYYAVWCPHCKNTKPAWEKAKKKLKKGGVDVKEVEEAQMTDEDKAKTSGFPTFSITKPDGSTATIVGERTDSDALVDEINGKLRGGGSRRRRTYRRKGKLRHRTLRNYKALA